MKKRLLLIILPTCFLLLSPASLSQDTVNDEFPVFLFQQGEYYRAVTEYFRLLHGSADSMARADIIRSIGRCSYAGGDYEGCIRYAAQYAPLLKMSPSARDDMFLLSARSHYQLQHYRETVEVLSWSGIQEGNALFAEKQILLGIAFARLQDWNAAQDAWLRADAETEPGRIAATLAGQAARIPERGKRSPFVAGLLSTVLPGAGYLYSGKPGTGIAALLINGLLAWAVYDAVRQEQYGIAATAGFLGIGWYIGNIAGSASAAEDYNSAIADKELDRILERVRLQEYRLRN